ncbi:MAG: right-handed parallel beta-helix repeat-containing protein [Ignavibacteriaceae bacterium]|nr:right-handed parallel beta-helix repeat-containing protein [Ignavibacteriaceae bacterium]
MIKKLLLILILAAVKLSAQYTTPNTGVNWNLDSLKQYAPSVVTGTFPDYTVSANVIIAANDRVTVLPGTKVTFTATTAGFEVNGTLKVLGTVSDSVYLRSQTEDSLGAWVGLLFNDTAVDTACEVHYANIMFATNGFRAINASPNLYNSTLYKNRVGVRFTGANSIVSGNRIERSFEYGIIMTLTSSPQILNNIIKDNNTQNTSAKNQVSIGLQGNNSPVITGNTISGGWSIRTGGISLWVSGSGAFSNAVIENNTIFNNSFGITLYATSGGAINALVRNNTIYNNKINPDVNVSGSGINVNGTTLNTPVITKNTIYGNWWGITIQNGTTVQAGPSPNLGNLTNADTTDDGRNYIYNNIQPTGTFDLFNNCTNDIMAQNNDWGVYDSAAIDSHIYHKTDNANHGSVFFMPFYDPSTIPVELVSFGYTKTASGLRVIWSTATETNNRGFELLATIRGGEETRIFIEGAGTSTETRNYEATLPLVQSGTYAIFLRQVDLDGTVNLLKETEAEFTLQTGGFALHGNYPNPFNPETQIRFELGERARVTLKFFTVSGELAAELQQGVMEAGVYTVSFNPAQFGLPTGVYFCELTAGSFRGVQKMVYLR